MATEIRFPYTDFYDWLTQSGLSATTAEMYSRYARAAFNVGITPVDNDHFASYVQRFVKSTRSRRRSAWRHWQRYSCLPDSDLLPAASAFGIAGQPHSLDWIKGFAEQLEQDGLALNTITQYVSTIRGVLRVTDDPTDKDAIWSYVESLALTHRARFAVVWSRFRVLHPGLPALDPTEAFPDAMASVVWYLSTQCCVMGSHARLLLWSDLIEVDGKTVIRYVPDPQPHRYYKGALPEEHMQALREWALPDMEGSPLLPSDLGGVKPMTQAVFRILVKRGVALNIGKGAPKGIGNTVNRAAVRKPSTDAPDIGGYSGGGRPRQPGDG